MGSCISFSLIKATNWSVLQELLFGQTKDLHTQCRHLKVPKEKFLFQCELLLTCKYSQIACSLQRRGTKDVWYERAGQWKCSQKLFRCFSNELTVLITVLFFFFFLVMFVYSGRVEEECATTRPGFCVPYHLGQRETLP